MTALERAMAYFDAWNAHDGAAILATFAPDGTNEDPRQLMREGPHRESMPSFFRDVSSGGWTSTWIPERINPHWLRCTACGQMEDAGKVTTCRCGAELPEAPSYF